MSFTISSYKLFSVLIRFDPIQILIMRRRWHPCSVETKQSLLKMLSRKMRYLPITYEQELLFERRAMRAARHWRGVREGATIFPAPISRDSICSHLEKKIMCSGYLLIDLFTDFVVTLGKFSCNCLAIVLSHCETSCLRRCLL